MSNRPNTPSFDEPSNSTIESKRQNSNDGEWRTVMSRMEYQEVMNEVENIAAAVRKFPEFAQGAACEAIFAALISPRRLPTELPANVEENSGGRIAAAEDSRNAETGTVKDLEWYADTYDLESCNDMEFSAFVAFYYCDVAQGMEKVDAIDGSQLKTACEVVGRDVPTNSNQTLVNAKTRKKYLQAKGAGKYVLSRQGRRYVRETLLAT